MKKILLITGCLILSLNVFAQPPSYVPTNGLQAWYPFNGNADDESGNGNHGVVNGASLVNDRNNNSNSAYEFDGVDDYIGNTSAITNDAPFTISAWVSPDDTSDNPIVTFGYSASGLDQLTFCVYKDAKYIAAQTAGANHVTNYNAVTQTQQWNHVVVVHSSGYDTSSFTFYVNGIEFASTFKGGTNNPFPMNSSGAIGAGRLSTFFDGKIDDIGIWGRALTQQEIQNLYTSTPYSTPAYVPTTGLIGWWPFNGNADDESGNGHHGTPNSCTLINDRDGASNSAYEFDGSNGYITLPANMQVLSSEGITFSYWVNTDWSQSLQYYIDLEQTFTNRIVLVSRSNNSYEFGYNSNTTLSDTIFYNYSQFNNNWVHCTGVVDLLAQESRLYINGQLIGTETLDTSITNINLSAGSFVIGARYTLAGSSQKSMDDIALWDRALTDSEIQNVYSATPYSTPAYVPTTGLIGWWPFNGNADDESGNGHHGVVNGATLTADQQGIDSSAYHFNGTTSQYIQVAHDSTFDFSSNEMTVSFWVNVESFPSGSFNKVLISQQSGSGNSQSGYNVFQSGSSTLGLRISSGGGDFGGAGVASNTGNYNQFHHIVIVFDNGIAKSYFNGVLYDSIANQTATIGSNSMPLLFGKANWINVNAEPFEGVLDDIALWNRALTPQEVMGLYIPCTKPDFVSLGSEGSTYLCPGDSVKIFVVNPSQPGLTYQWFKANQPIAGATDDHYYISGSAKYKVRVSSGVGCDRNSGRMQAIIISPPSVSITPQGSTDICAGDSVLLSANVVPGYDYQWLRYGNPIQGATSPDYYATQNGNYKVRITQTSGSCQSVSSLVSVNIVCRVAGTQFMADVGVSPNPANNNFKLSLVNTSREEMPQNVEVRDMSGRLVESRVLIDSSTQTFNTTSWQQGLYSVKVAFQDGSYLERTVSVIH